MKKNRTVCKSMLYGFSGLAAGIAPAAQTLAGDMLDEVTVTAMRMESKIGNVPATVSIYSAERYRNAARAGHQGPGALRAGRLCAIRARPFHCGGARRSRRQQRLQHSRPRRQSRADPGRRRAHARRLSFGPQSVGRGDYVDLDLLKSRRNSARSLLRSLWQRRARGLGQLHHQGSGRTARRGRNWSLGASAGYASADEVPRASCGRRGPLGDLETLVAYTRRDGEGQETQRHNNPRTSTEPRQPGGQHVECGPRQDGLFPSTSRIAIRLTLDHLDRDIGLERAERLAKPPPLRRALSG